MIESELGLFTVNMVVCCGSERRIRTFRENLLDSPEAVVTVFGVEPDVGMLFSDARLGAEHLPGFLQAVDRGGRLQLRAAAAAAPVLAPDHESRRIVRLHSRRRNTFLQIQGGVKFTCNAADRHTHNAAGIYSRF